MELFVVWPESGMLMLPCKVLWVRLWPSPFTMLSFSHYALVFVSPFVRSAPQKRRQGTEVGDSAGDPVQGNDPLNGGDTDTVDAVREGREGTEEGTTVANADWEGEDDIVFVGAKDRRARKSTGEPIVLSDED